MERKCSACKEMKSVEDFYVCRAKTSGRAAICKVCRQIKYQGPRSRRNRAAGKCACGRDPLPGLARCAPCHERGLVCDKRSREYVKEHGLCGNCRKEKAAVGYTTCDACAAKKSARQSKHGGDVTVRQALFAAQNGLCPICNEPLLGWLRMVHAVVDHDHKTGKTRGLLHGQCNMGIGCLGDSPARLEAAAAYLRKHT